MSKPKILVLHALRPSSRQTTIEHLVAFRKFLPSAGVQYLHFAQPIPRDICENLAPDLVIVNYDFLNYRFSPLWPYIKKRHREIARRAKRVVAIAQDDFWAFRLLDNWCVSWQVDRILTPIESNLEVLYPRSIKSTEIRTVLAGYAPSSTVRQAPLRDRQIDLGQRVRLTPPSLGGFAREKAVLALRLAHEFSSRGLMTDVSIRPEDSFVGNEWLKFLSNCKFTVSMKGGASVADPYGLLYMRHAGHTWKPTNEEPASLPRSIMRRDHLHKFSTVSPRLFEAAQVGTCQILRKDNYLEGMEPWVHYIPLEPDLSNIQLIFNRIRNLDEMEMIAENCSNLLIKSGRFSYQHFVTAAVEGFLDSPNQLASDDQLASKTWHAFKSFSKQSSSLDVISKSQHDAIVNYVHAELSGNLERRRLTRVFDVMLDGDNKVFTKSWLNWYREICESDRFVLRVPWSWRAISDQNSQVADF